jgi:DNA-binding transcriptional ArsR family regulator
MNIDTAVTALSALAHAHRLKTFRLLVRQGPSGLAAGEIAAHLKISPSALSFHLAHLERSGLLRTWRQGRQCRYAVDIEGMRRLMAFLTEDCCGGHPEICGGLAASAVAAEDEGVPTHDG